MQCIGRNCGRELKIVLILLLGGHPSVGIVAALAGALDGL